MSKEILLQADNLCFKNMHEPQWLLEKIAFLVKSGEVHGITGKSGTGKTTLLNLLGGLEVAQLGEIELCKQKIHTLSDDALSRLRQEKIGFIFQAPNLLPDFSTTENIALSLLVQGHTYMHAIERSVNIMKDLDIYQLHNKSVQSLSGGEKQRVNIARAIIHKPEIIFADEPTGCLDQENAEIVQNMLFDLSQTQGTALVIVSHDKQFISKTEYTWELRAGSIHSI